MVKNPPASAEDASSIPGLEGPLEEEMATHSSILAWRIPWTKKPGGLQSIGLQESDMTEQLSTKQKTRLFDRWVSRHRACKSLRVDVTTTGIKHSHEGISFGSLKKKFPK